MSQPGRACPLHYRYSPSVFATPAEAACDVLYVVGGVYGNEFALQRVLELFDAERGDKRLVFNGDFNWFDIDAASFQRLNEAVLAFDATRGNVETELMADSGEMGCGCAYPDWVGDEVVHYSNTIMAVLQQTARAQPALAQRLARLPMWRRIDVAGRRVAIVHGDAVSLSGWGFAQESLSQPAHRAQVEDWLRQARVDIFASSHTCLPVFERLASGIVLNNGAAGMPNFAGTQYGLFTRIATTPAPAAVRCFGFEHGGLFLDALELEFDASAWQQTFVAQWPPGSAGHRSYWRRIVEGPSYRVRDALRPPPTSDTISPRS